MRAYRYSMGIRVKNAGGDGWVNLPDPSEWTYQISDLDTEGGRDATGLLHRAYVATKINYQFAWTSLDWDMLQIIVGAIQPQGKKARFKLEAPDPRTFSTKYTGTYYCGDRSGKCYHYIREGDTTKFLPEAIPEHYPNWSDPVDAQFELKVNFIEY